MKSKKVIKEAAIRLRKEHHIGLEDIANQFGVAKSTVSLWCRGIEIPRDVYKNRMLDGVKKYHSEKRGEPKPPQKLWNMLNKDKVSTLEKGDISEAAIVYRLKILRLSVFNSVSDGTRTDLIVQNKDGVCKKIQVRSVSDKRRFRVTCCDGTKNTRKLAAHEVDFVVAYDFYSDTAYVYSYYDIEKYSNNVTVKDVYAEQWNKLFD